jgi:hypothetical protein
MLEIPHGFERNLVREGSQQVNLSVDAINGIKSSIGSGYLTAVLADFNRSLDMNIEPANSSAVAQSFLIDITYSGWFNPRREYKYYMVPGILVLLLTLIGGFITALNIVREKEIGTIEQINVTPDKEMAVYSRKADTILDCRDDRLHSWAHCNVYCVWHFSQRKHSCSLSFCCSLPGRAFRVWFADLYFQQQPVASHVRGFLLHDDLHAYERIFYEY